MSATGVIRVAPTGSKASPNVRYAFNGDQICASQRTDAMCQHRSSDPSTQGMYLVAKVNNMIPMICGRKRT